MIRARASYQGRWSVAVLVPLIGALLGFVSHGWGQITEDREGEVKLVRSVLDQLDKANQDRNLDLVLAQYSDDAKIDSKAARAKVSKAAYKDAVIQLWQKEPKLWSEYKGIRVSLTDSTHAVAEGTVYIHLTNGSNIISKHEWKLEKRDGRWLIVETNYK